MDSWASAMPERYGEEWLAAVLADVGARLVVPARAEQVADVPRVVPRGRPHRVARRRWALVLAATVAVAAGLVLTPPVREGVADWLGIGTTSVRSVPDKEGDPTGLPALDDALRTVTPRAAEVALGASLPDAAATRLGLPDRLAVPPEGGVVLVWAEGATTLWVRRPGEAALLPLAKLVAGEEEVRAVGGLGDAALLVEGDHVLVTPHRRLRARAVLLWTVGDTEYRLESDLTPAAMIEVARSM